MNAAIQDELYQQQALQFARALSISSVRGMPGASLLKFTGVIPLDDFKIMEQAIEDGCEQVNLNAWKN